MPRVPPENPLKSQIVNRKNRFCSGCLSIACSLRFEIDDHQSRLPVVAVNDIHGLMAQPFQSGPAKKNKPLGVVGIIALDRAIKKFPVKVWIGTDKMNGDALVEGAVKHSCFHQAIRNWH